MPWVAEPDGVIVPRPWNPDLSFTDPTARHGTEGFGTALPYFCLSLVQSFLVVLAISPFLMSSIYYAIKYIGITKLGFAVDDDVLFIAGDMHAT